jgi:hypothetical protein
MGLGAERAFQVGHICVKSASLSSNKSYLRLLHLVLYFGKMVLCKDYVISDCSLVASFC